MKEKNVKEFHEEKIINIFINEETKKEDLLGKYILQENQNINFKTTNLLKAITIEENCVIIFHNINKASGSILEILETIIDKEIAKIPLSNGELKHKSKTFQIIMIIDNENGIFNYSKIPSSLKKNQIILLINK